MTPFSLSNRVRRILFGLAFVLISVGNLQAAYVVKKGDTFYSLARKNGVTVQALMKANGISDPSRLKIGMRLTVPSKSGSSVKRVSLRATTPAKATTSSRVTRSKTIILDPGHGGRDKGAVYGGVRESDLNLKTALKAERYLKSAGYKVVLTRRRDCYVSLARRASIANRYRNAVFISIHYNASHHSSVRGGETFYGGSSSSRYLCSSVQRNLVSLCKVKNRGARQRGFSVLRNTNCPAVLVECGFISNSSERSRCRTSSFQDAAARSILAGVQRWDRSY